MERAGLVTYVLVLPTENLHSRRELRTFSYRSLTEDAVASHIDSGADPRFRVSEERAKRNPAGHVAFSQGQVIISNSKVVADAPRNGGTRLREECVDGLHATEARECCAGPRNNQKYAVPTALEKFSDHDFIVSVSFDLNLISETRTRCTLGFRRWSAVASD